MIRLVRTYLETCKIIRTSIDLLVAIASRNSVLRNTLIRRHHSTATTVSKEHNFIDGGLIAEIAHSKTNVLHHQLKVQVRHLPGFAGVVVGAKDREASRGQPCAGHELKVILLGMHHEHGKIGLVAIRRRTMKTSNDAATQNEEGGRHDTRARGLPGSPRFGCR